MIDNLELEPVDYYCNFCDSAMELVADCDDGPYCPGWHCMGCGLGKNATDRDWVALQRGECG